ncbi:MAG TPA: hypothetical protein VGM25_14235 [Caulobacteraceae bacterium]|jgi:hypothetical protein
MSPRTRSAILVALAAAVALPALAAAAAADQKAGPARKPAAAKSAKTSKLPDWRGVWGPSGSRNIDPDIASGAFQANAPLNPEYAKRYQDYLAAVKAGKPRGDIGCLPEGPPRIMRSPYPIEVVVTPDETWILAEFKHEVRRVYTDGRKVPDDLDPTYEGYSTGHWEGDTLVFDTVGLKAGTLDSGGLEHSDALKLHERIRRASPDTLDDQITMTDPKVFTKPWTVTRQYKLHKDWEIKEFTCEENDRNPINSSGQTGVTLKK